MNYYLKTLLILLVASVYSFATQSFELPGLAADANNYTNSLRAKAPPQITPAQREAAIKQVRTVLSQKDATKTINACEAAVTLGVDNTTLWLTLSEAWTTAPKLNRERALQAAYLAYRAAAKPDERATALWRITIVLDELFDRPDQALQAAQEILNIIAEINSVAAYVPDLERRITALHQRVGLTLQSVEVLSDEAIPKVCLHFSDPLSQRKDIHFMDFIRLQPNIQTDAEANDQALCLTGLSFGTTYTVTVRQGLPGEKGLTIKKDETQSFHVPDHKPLVAFRGTSFILPRIGSEGVPVISINLDHVKLKVYRINDRNLVNNIRYEETGYRFNEQLSDYSADELANNNGELVWEGKMAVQNALNREVVTALPFRELVPNPQPGLYVITAEPFDVANDFHSYDKATQWLVVSDIGLTLLRGADGINVFARSYSTAQPLAGVEIALLARNNAELARATSDALGRVRFPVGLTRGTGGKAPFAVMAYQGADFAVIDLNAAAFDLSDRGVSGRTPPGAMDAFLYTDRGIYRQGETVNLSVLLRNADTQAIENFPLTVKILRPSGTEYYAGLLPAGPAGGFFLPLKLSKTAPLGTWQVQTFSDPKGSPIGQLSFQVDDFVPERLALELTPAAKLLEPGKPFDLMVKGNFLYGPPAVGLNGSAEVSLQADPQPYPQYKNYHFGLMQEELNQQVEELEFPTTDSAGLARIVAKLPPLPDTTRPLRAEFRVTLSEPGGRPARQSITVPVRTQSYAIGIHPRFEGGAIAEGQGANFEVVAVAPDGASVAKSNLSWELIEERTTYQWYFKEGRYNYQSVTRTVPRRSGKLTLTADKPAVVTLDRLEFGRYRLEIVDKSTNVASSLRFSSGWQMADAAGDTPDKVTITADKPTYALGETARLKLMPPFAGEVLLTVATDRIFDARTFSVPASGTTVEVPIDAAWGPGAYVTATVYRPPLKGRERQPVRAIGLTWLNIDPAARSLAVTMHTAEIIRPRQTLAVDLKVAPASGKMEEAWVTLAAVDEGILQLTDFASPDPGSYLFGKRLLGLDIHDDYGRLIDALDGPFGVLHQGGDASGAGLPVVPFTVVSLFSGPIKINAAGNAHINFAIPDFNGQLRLMAVAWGSTRVGATSTRVIVRDPLVANVTLPRFIAPNDNSNATVSVHNVEAQAGHYTAHLQGSAVVSVENGELEFDLTVGERRDVVVPIKGTGVGIGKIELTVTGPDSLTVKHAYEITARPARSVETQFIIQPMPPGDTVRLSNAQLAGYLAGTGKISATFSSSPPFDVAGILRALDRYPHGCLEQTVSRALPLLVVRDIEATLGTVENQPDNSLAGRVQQAILRVLDKQRYDGSFATWGSSGETHPWLTGYAVEFLIRALNKGYAVPEKPLQDALAWLRNHAIDGEREAADLASRAYALHVLALAGVMSGGAARYFHDTYLEQLPTPLAKAQLGAALARLGDRERAQKAFAAATANLARDYWHIDYGSTTRDIAALITLMSEVNLNGGALNSLLQHFSNATATANMTNTQEQAWLLLAADRLMSSGTPLALTWTGNTNLKGDPITITPTNAQLKAEGVAITNIGKANIWQALSLAGVPTEPRPAAREGLRIKRNFLDRKGQALNLDQIHQNDVFVIVLEGEASTKLDHQLIITHPLPAGWEIEKIGIEGGEDTDFPWLTDLTTPATVEGRDDRYVAAVELTPNLQKFKLAYLVRAVTVGAYELPGAQVEDMYRPRFFARQAAGKIVVNALQ